MGARGATRTTRPPYLDREHRIRDRAVRSARQDRFRYDHRYDDRWDRFDRRYYRARPKRYYRRKHDRRNVFVDIDINVGWPWQHRYRRHWQPRYRYRQVVYVDVGWDGRRRDAYVDVQTYYSHRVRYADGRRAEIDIFIEEIELYDRRGFLGRVTRVPDDLAHIRATVYANGRVDFDRDVFVVGDPRVGFEMVSTRHYDGFVLDAYRPGHGYRVGHLDLRRERVDRVRRSRLFDYGGFAGHVPISLLPEDDGWLLDYGYEAVSANYFYDRYDDYYERGYYDYEDEYFYGYDDDAYEYYGRPGIQAEARAPVPQRAPLRTTSQTQLRTRIGAEVELRRDVEIARLR